MDPPQCVQNAMMTKDKKPFTYTPGGINLSEIRSPRMARRIERNANAGGVGDTPRPPPPPQNVGPLPPSALAAMRPQPQVQVFPGPPPPPPMQSKGMPPPPPPPMQPLPTQKVKTSDNQTLERPDMTKIIPENPIALLRKTGGPAPRKSFVEEMYEQQNKNVPPAGTPPYAQDAPRYQPPVIERQPAAYSPPAQQQRQPGWQQQQGYQQPQPQVYKPPSQQAYQSPEKHPEQPRYQQPATPRSSDVPVKTSTAHLGSLYIPPVNQQTKVASPPTPPERQPQIQSPGTPTLKEAPRPWQTKVQQQAQELPPWARRDDTDHVQNVQISQSPPAAPQNIWQNQAAPAPPQRWQAQSPRSPAAPQQAQNNYEPQPSANNQQRWQPQSPRSPPTQTQPQRAPQAQPQTFPVHIEIRTNMPYQDSFPPEDRKPNAVYVTQPIVLQHPGSAPPLGQRQAPKPQPEQSPRVDSQGARIIPIQIEGRTSQSPVTPGNERSFNRQQSWGNTPPQSNAFKVIQKITQTDDESDEDAPVTEHAPRYPQNFQQAPVDKLRGMKLNDGDQNLINRFKQVPQGSPVNQGQSRTIPVQMEGNGVPQKYVHPSEQVVPEPKKYTGSSIPSRSFKILQAMTAPETCASAKEEEDTFCYTSYPYYDPNHPMFYPPPYWYEYQMKYYHQNQSEFSKNGSSEPTINRGRTTPLPFWPCAPPVFPYQVPGNTENIKGANDSYLQNYPQACPYPYSEYETSDEESERNSMYRPPFDPYYYYYYYGYPPMMPPYPYTRSSTEETNGYSSNGEQRRFSHESSERQELEDRECVTPTPNGIDRIVEENKTAEISIEGSQDSDAETTDNENEEFEHHTEFRINTIRSIKSVNNVNVFVNNEIESSGEECSEDNSDTDDESCSAMDEEIVPHELSVIYEESERTESKLIRSDSVISDSTTIADKSDDEEEPEELLSSPRTTQIKFSVSISEEHSNVATIDLSTNQVRAFEEDSRINSIANLSSSEQDIKENYETNGECIVINNVQVETDNEDKQSDEDWWSVLGKEDDLPKLKTIVNCVDSENIEAPTEEENNQSTISHVKETQPIKDISVYDKLKENDDGEPSGEKIMEVESFVEKLEELKRLSGLWNFDNCTTKATNEEEKCREEESFKVTENDVQIRSEFVTNESEASCCEDKSKEENNDDEIDFWSQIKNDDDDFVPRKSLSLYRESENDIDSASSRNSSFSESHTVNNAEKVNNDVKIANECLVEEVADEVLEDIEPKDCKEAVKLESKCVEKMEDRNNYTDKKEESISNSLLETMEETNNLHIESSLVVIEDQKAKETLVEDNNCGYREEQPLKIKDRIQALRESIKRKQSIYQAKEEINVCVKQKISAIEVSGEIRSKSTSAKSSVKSFEEYSEEEGDSGVLSDLSRHISEAEEFTELKKLSRYQRAATHSRLYKLLQDECDQEDSDEETETKVSIVKEVSTTHNRDHLTLSLNKTENREKETPVNEKLVNELIQSLLSNKKGQAFRNIPKEKLQAAATKILQEDIDIMVTPEDFSSLLSPLNDDTQNSTPIQTPQEFYSNYNDYRQYYESFGDAEKDYCENYDILPSKAFKLLQEQLGSSKMGVIEGLLAKCPRILSSKNVHRDLMKMLENSPDCPSPTPDKSTQSNEVTNTS